MKRSHLVTVWLLLGGPILAVSAATGQLSCPQMPDKITQVSHDVRSDVEVGVGTLGKLKAGQLGVKTDVIAKNLFDKYPNIDRLVVVQMMSATYCEMIRDSRTLKDSEKIHLWSEFSDRVFKFVNPTYNAPPAQAPKSKKNPTPANKSNPASAGPGESGKSEERNVTQAVAPCGIAQVGNKNVATVNCAPPERHLDEATTKRLAAAYKSDGTWIRIATLLVPETQHLASEIAVPLHVKSREIEFLAAFDGIAVIVHDQHDSAVPAATEILKALAALEPHVRHSTDPSLAAPGTIFIMVGSPSKNPPT
jgi:hypothetical protein